jgi:type I restriction enzyme S subunit
MSEWKEYILEDVIEKFIDYRGKTPRKTSFGIPLMTAKIIKGGRLLEPTEYIAKEDYFDWMTRGFPEINDVLLTTEAPLGEVALVKDKNVALGQRIITLQTRKDLCDSVFLKYYLQSFEGQATLQSRASGSTVEGIKSAELKKIEISLPPLTEQKNIALILFNLDNKIDLLHRQNATLEKMAETLFRQWFVEEAKEDWETMPLSQMANFLNGLACQKFPPKNEIDKLPVLKIKELSSGITENSDWASTDIKPEYFVRNGDVIFAWSASLMVKIWDGQDCILNQHLFKVTSKDYPKWFYYLWCKHHLAEFISIAASHATTMGHIKRGDLDEALVLIPNEEDLSAMTQKVDPIIEKVITNQTQILTLTALRDTLLPKLMSGEVRVEK